MTTNPADHSPIRIQRRREKGWRTPPGAVIVTRPSIWGNPFAVGRNPGELFPRGDAVRMHRELLLDGATTFTHEGRDSHFERSTRPGDVLYVPTVDQIREHLAGHDLACWCPIDVSCHADLLLEIANPRTEDNG